MLRNVVVALGLLLAPLAVEAKEWAQKMFQATSHDFGNVARGAKAEFAFELQNLYEEDIHIADVRTSCGCTTPTITKSTLKTWEKGTIVATLNTRSFVGQRNSTLTVVIDKPFYAAVGEQIVSVTYRGSLHWQIADVRSANSHLEVELSEALRQPGMVSYKMVVRVKADAPPGILQDQLTLVTNDQRMPTVVLPVEGRVAPPLSVSPSPLLFGTLAPGQSATKQLVITGKQPFKVLSLTADSEGLQYRAAPDVSKKVHLVPITVEAPQQPGEFHYSLTIETDLPSAGKATCLVRGTVRGDSPTAAKNTRPGENSVPR
jgi:hypothetical protein